MYRALVVPGKAGRRNHQENPMVHTPSSETRLDRAEVTDPTLPGKTSKHQVMQTVPETDTGRQGENPKALERTRVKELGKLTP